MLFLSGITDSKALILTLKSPRTLRFAEAIVLRACDLRGCPLFKKKLRDIDSPLARSFSWPCRYRFGPSPRSCKRRVSNRKLSETMTAMSLVERWMKISADKKRGGE